MNRPENLAGSDALTPEAAVERLIVLHDEAVAALRQALERFFTQGIPPSPKERSRFRYPELRLVYFSTGQPAPWSTALRGPGDSLYTNTVLAVDAQTGKIRWHFQLNPADDWDRAGYESMLVDLTIGGRVRKALIQTGKMGWGVVLDRQTGEFLHAFKTAYDNVVTGWTPQGRPIVNPALIPTPADWPLSCASAWHKAPCIRWASMGGSSPCSGRLRRWAGRATIGPG